MRKIGKIDLRAGVRRMVSSIGAELAPVRGPRILMYHRVCESNHRLAVRPDQFRAHLDLLQRRGTEVLSIRDLLDRSDEPGLNAVALSFDDGYPEMATVVADELIRRSMGATFFVLPRFADDPQVISPEAKFPDGGMSVLSHDEIRSLHRSGFEIGAHSLTHRSMTDLHWTESRDEIHGSRRELSALIGADVAGFAYPRGHYGTLHGSQVEAAGYRYGVSVRPGPVEAGLRMWDLPRSEVAGGDTPELLENKLNGGLDIWHSVLQRVRSMSDINPRYVS